MVILVLITSFYIKQKSQKNLLYIKNRGLAQQLEDRAELKNRTKLSGIENSQKSEIHNFIHGLIDIEFYLDKDITLQKMAKKGTKKGLRFGLSSLGELIPLLGALPFWTIFVILELKQDTSP